jgi:hypothetical protein
MQTANPNPAALSTTRNEEQQNHLPAVLPRGNPRVGPGFTIGDTALTERVPIQEDWEWHMQSREGSIRYRTGPDDPRVA